jgi:hypothetical protein
MKTCPNCHSEVEDNFELCWNCQYSFTDAEVLADNEFKLICPACNAEIDASYTTPHCLDTKCSELRYFYAAICFG